MHNRRQEIFDKVISHLRQQGDKSFLHDYYGQCAYQDPDSGNKCAIGCLIEDHEYDEWMEEKNIMAVLENTRCPESLKDRFKDHYEFMRGLQLIHDTVEVSQWEKQFEWFAKTNGLVYKVT